MQFQKAIEIPQHFLLISVLNDVNCVQEMRYLVSIIGTKNNNN